MIDLGLFRIRAFNAALATNFLAIFVAVGYFLFVAQYLQLVVGLSPAGGRAVVAARRRSAFIRRVASSRRASCTTSRPA